MNVKAVTNRFINIASAIPAAVVSIAGMLVFDRRTFTFPQKGDEGYELAMTDYGICRILAFFALFFIIRMIISLIMCRDEKRDAAMETVKCALLYLPVVIAVMVIKLPAGFLTNDEYAIAQSAYILKHDTWFNIMTVYYYIVSFMILPIKMSPVFMKALIELAVCGYTVYRTKGYFGKRAGLFAYVLFLLYPVIAYTTSAHRLPVYFLLYLALFVKLMFDRLEGRPSSAAGILSILAAGAVLTQWRTEGIYLAPLILILVFMVYPDIRQRNRASLIVFAYILMQVILWIPQNGAVSGNLGGAADDRMKPFYAYTITNMFRNGLDTEKNASDLGKVDPYLSIDAINAINDHYGDINYEDVLILYADGFVGVREGAGDAEFYDYSQALKRIFANNPQVFAATRWGAFCYAALPYHIDLSGSAVSSVVSIVKTVSYNLFIPVGLVFGLFIFSLITRRWYSFFVFGGLIAHWFLVFVLAPASYFKYYFPVYILAYFYLIMLLIWLFYGKGRGMKCPLD